MVRPKTVVNTANGIHRGVLLCSLIHSLMFYHCIRSSFWQTLSYFQRSGIGDFSDSRSYQIYTNDSVSVKQLAIGWGVFFNHVLAVEIEHENHA